MKIKYVGVKTDGETAFIGDTGITWMPGDSHPVADRITVALATRMLQHPDVFALDDEETPRVTLQPHQPTPAASTVTTSAAAPGSNVIKTPAGEVNLDGKTAEELRALAKELDVKVHFNAGIPKVTEALLAAFPAGQ